MGTNKLSMTMVAIGFILATTGARAQVCEEPWRMEETLRIGSLEGDDALSTVTDLELGPAGEIYVTQHFTPRVTVFSSDGRFTRTIGRAGQGPGEFDTAARELGWLGDSLWVSDRSAVHVFGPEGTGARQVRFSTTLRNEGSRFTAGTPLSDGSFLGNRTVFGDIPAFFRAERLHIPRFSDEGRILDTLASVTQGLVVQGEGFTYHPLDGARGNSWLRFAVTADASGIVLVGDIRPEGPAPSFDLLLLDVTGDTIWTRAVPFEPKRVTREDRIWSTEVFGAYMAGDYRPEGRWPGHSDARKERERRAGEDAIAFPRYLPPVRQIVAGHDGTVWLLRELTLPDLPDRWDVYGPGGTSAGTVLITEGRSNQVPWYPRLSVLRATRDELWGMTVDEWDVPYIHRYRLTCG